MSQTQNLTIPASSLTTSMVLTDLDHRLAEAARYAVLQRLMPFLRHDVAGAMQPVRMLFMVLQKRLQSGEPDVQAIAKNVVSASTLSRQASATCLMALDWMTAHEDMHVSLRSFIDQASALMAVELAGKGLSLVNGIEDDATTASQAFLRSVLMGALLALCDQHTDGGILHVTFIAAAATTNPAGQVHLRMVAAAAKPAAALQGDVRRYRAIGSPDLLAMAQSFGVQITMTPGRITLELPG